MFRVGEVWMWDKQIFLLLRRKKEKEDIWATVRSYNEQLWEAFGHTDGVKREVLVHTNTVDNVQEWVKLS